MTVTLILVAAAGFALLFFLLRLEAIRTNLRAKTASDSELLSVDLDAFRNLTDPSEEEFLRTNLARSEFRVIQRERMLVAVQYVIGTFHNAAVLLQLGQDARRSPDPRVADAGRHLVDNAIRLRFYAVLAITRLCVRIALPGTSVEPAGVVNHYQEMNSWASLLRRLQPPAGSALTSGAL